MATTVLLDLDSILPGSPADGFVPVSSAPREGWGELVRGANVVLATRLAPERSSNALRSLGLTAEQTRVVSPVDREHACQQIADDGANTPSAETDDETLVAASARPADLSWAAGLAQSGRRVIPVGLDNNTADRSTDLEQAGAWFVARDLAELSDIALAPSRSLGLSVVLMAFNESATIGAAIVEARRFCRLYLSDYEILVVDDGSQDGTEQLASEAAEDGDVRVLRHQSNRGMGASMRTGYRAARKDYLVALPADRQIRAQQLCPFLPLLAPDRCVHGYYDVPHSGPVRALMSATFRLVVQHGGGLRVDFDGAYAFHRRWLERVDLDSLYSDSFVFSFELLEQLRRAGCRFSRREMRAFARVAGQSRVARPGRVARVFAEVLRARAERALSRSAFRSQ